MPTATTSASENLDLVGLAGANAAAAFTGTFVVNGSPTKTEMVDSAGGRSQIAHLTKALIVLVVILFLTKPLSFLPSGVLSAIVFLIGVKLIDLKGMRELYRLQKDEFTIALATAATLILGTVLEGILVAVLLSLIAQVRHSYRVRARILTRDATGSWQPVPMASGIVSAPGRCSRAKRRRQNERLQCRTRFHCRILSVEVLLDTFRSISSSYLSRSSSGERVTGDARMGRTVPYRGGSLGPGADDSIWSQRGAR